MIRAATERSHTLVWVLVFCFCLPTRCFVRCFCKCEEFKLVYNITVGLPIVVYRLSLNKGLSDPCSSLHCANPYAPAKRVGLHTVYMRYAEAQPTCIYKCRCLKLNICFSNKYGSLFSNLFLQCWREPLLMRQLVSLNLKWKLYAETN